MWITVENLLLCTIIAGFFKKIQPAPWQTKGCSPTPKESRFFIFLFGKIIGAVLAN